MSEAVVDDIVAVLPPLLNRSRHSASSPAISIRRHSSAVMEAVGAPDEALAGGTFARSASGRSNSPDCATGWIAPATSARRLCRIARGRARQWRSRRGVSRAAPLPRAQEALYPLAAKFPPVSSFFLNPAVRENADLLARLASAASEDTGIFHDHNEPGSRGGFSLYVPEYYTPDRAWPLVMALHGGSGNGRGFLWSWLRDARSFGAILVAPTATGSTWALMGEDTDTPNLMRILDAVRSRWTIDPRACC